MTTEFLCEKIYPNFEEEQRDLATLVRVIVVEDNQSVRVTVQKEEQETWFDTSTVIDLVAGESTELLVDVNQRLIVSEIT